MTTRITRQRLHAVIVGAIYRIVDHLLPVIATLVSEPTRSWTERARLDARFSLIVQRLLALTARIHPAKLVQDPVYPVHPAPPVPTGPRAAPAVRHAPAPFLSQRRFARCLARLLDLLQRLAAELAATLPDPVRRNLARLHRLARTDRLPTAVTWERTG